MINVIREFTAAQVREAVAQYVESSGGEIGLWSAYDGVDQILGMNRHQARDTHAWKRTNRFQGQVYRALNELTQDANPQLIKVGKGDRGPHGRTVHEPTYYTWAAFEAAEKERQAQQAIANAEALRWAAVHDALALRGIANLTRDQHPRGDWLGKPVTISLEDWERLMGIGEQ